MQTPAPHHTRPMPGVTPPLVSELLTTQGTAEPVRVPQKLERSLRAVRTHLGMDVAFVSEFINGQRVFRHVDARRADSPVRPGGSDPLEASYCQRVVDGRLPQLIRDAGTIPEACSLPVTTALPVGAHLSVPILLSDGRIYGTFCCFSFTPDPTLNERDLAVLRVFAEMAADLIDEEIRAGRFQAEAKARICSLLESDALAIVYQPIYHVKDRRIVGFESLSRFSALPLRPPDAWFNEAAGVGLGSELELKAAALALPSLSQLPDDVYLSINFSPGTILSGRLPSTLGGWPLARVVLEVTEHASIDEYAGIASALAPLREEGLRLAVDDAGAGYASFRHILSLRPDIIKLDVSITRNIDTDPARYALARALIGFAKATESRIVAEGVETASELAVLRKLGVNKAQGYYIGKPADLSAARRVAIEGIAFPRIA